MSSETRYAPSAFSPSFHRVMDELAKIDWANRKAGADLRLETHRIAKDHDPIRQWIEVLGQLANGSK